MAVSLCADCFAVSLCSSVTLKKIAWRDVARVSAAFAVIQTLLLFTGWLFGSLIVGLVSKVSGIIGFLLLLYVGGSMLLEALKGGADVRDLNGWANVILGGVATSIDALALGVAQSMASYDFRGVLPLVISVFIVTALSVIAGIWGGRTLGSRLGRVAEIVGGLVLIGIGVSLLFRA